MLFACVCFATRLWLTSTIPPTCFSVPSLVRDYLLQLVAKTNRNEDVGEAPLDPVISTKSGHIYERRLITKYITENGTDPLTGEKLEESDLLTVKASE